MRWLIERKGELENKEMVFIQDDREKIEKERRREWEINESDFLKIIFRVDPTTSTESLESFDSFKKEKDEKTHWYRDTIWQEDREMKAIQAESRLKEMEEERKRYIH